ncbi:unnamed protein product [Rhizoctonia solani]|uniref:Uncharacterized protein n=1 Tax=Rhizoctonia solani TaxID=456999 RepID=A0A8H3HRH3_9AGAM|nr:unnamed protein product [Rhizoctonia solani]
MGKRTEAGRVRGQRTDRAEVGIHLGPQVVATFPAVGSLLPLGRPAVGHSATKIDTSRLPIDPPLGALSVRLAWLSSTYCTRLFTSSTLGLFLAAHPFGYRARCAQIRRPRARGLDSTMDIVPAVSSNQRLVRSEDQLPCDAIRDARDLYDPCMVGWDSVNKPGEGYSRLHDLNVVPPPPATQENHTAENWAFGSPGPKRDGYVTIEPAERTIRADPDTEEDAGDGTGDESTNDGDGDVPPCGRWARAFGPCTACGLDRPSDTKSGEIPILRPDSFERPPFDPSRHVVFVADYWHLHFRDYIARIRPSHPESIFFAQPPCLCNLHYSRTRISAVEERTFHIIMMGPL